MRPPKKHPSKENPERWARMNEGQKRYANEQWMLSLVRRGIHFPLPGEDQAPDEPDTHTVEEESGNYGT